MMGFDVVASFAPNNAPMIAQGGGVCSSVNTGCITQSTSNASTDLPRYRNEFEIGLRYRNTAGPVGFAVSGVYTVSAATLNGPSAAVNPRFNGLNMGMVGAEVTINKYLAIGANALFGAFNGSWALQNKPFGAQTSATTAIAWVAGARYTIPQLPATVGASYFKYKYQGTPGLATQRVSEGIDVGLTYGLGPGAIIVAEYLWGQNKQGGVNFLGGPNAALNNIVQEQMFLLGTSLRF
jgi:hypothetical protein